MDARERPIGAANSRAMGSREFERTRGYGALARGVRALNTQPRLPLGGGSEGVQGGFPLKRDARMVCL